MAGADDMAASPAPPNMVRGWKWEAWVERRVGVLATHLLVVPVTFLPVLRAEHTTTTRLL